MTTLRHDTAATQRRWRWLLTAAGSVSLAIAFPRPAVATTPPGAAADAIPADPRAASPHCEHHAVATGVDDDRAAVTVEIFVDPNYHELPVLLGAVRRLVGPRADWLRVRVSPVADARLGHIEDARRLDATAAMLGTPSAPIRIETHAEPAGACARRALAMNNEIMSRVRARAGPDAKQTRTYAPWLVIHEGGLIHRAGTVSPDLHQTFRRVDRIARSVRQGAHASGPRVEPIARTPIRLLEPALETRPLAPHTVDIVTKDPLGEATSRRVRFALALSLTHPGAINLRLFVHGNAAAARNARRRLCAVDDPSAATRYLRYLALPRHARQTAAWQTWIDSLDASAASGPSCERTTRPPVTADGVLVDGIHFVTEDVASARRILLRPPAVDFLVPFP